MSMLARSVPHTPNIPRQNTAHQPDQSLLLIPLSHDEEHSFGTIMQNVASITNYARETGRLSIEQENELMWSLSVLGRKSGSHCRESFSNLQMMLRTKRTELIRFLAGVFETMGFGGVQLKREVINFVWLIVKWFGSGFVNLTLRSPLIELLIRTLEPSKIDFGDGDLHSITMNIVTSILRLGSAGEGEEELENEKTLNGMLLERVIMPLEEYLIILFRRVDDNQSEWYLESKGSVLEAFSRIAIADKGTQEFYWRIGMALKVFRLLADMENDMGQLSHLGALSRQFSSWSRAPVGLEEILKWFFGFMEEGVMDVVESRMVWIASTYGKNIGDSVLTLLLAEGGNVKRDLE